TILQTYAASISQEFLLESPRLAGAAMNRKILHSITIAIVVLIAVQFLPAQDLTPEQKEVWQMEETYWKDVKEGNVDHYMTLWHDNFLGWPRDIEKPVGKDGLAQSVKRKMASGHVSSYEFLSKAVSVTGNVGVVQYSVRVVRAINGASD